MTGTPNIRIQRPIQAAPILTMTAASALAIRGSTTVEIDGQIHTFEEDTAIALGDLVAGKDYGVGIDDKGSAIASLLSENPLDTNAVAGFHFAPGGCAEGRGGGDSVPTINPHSLWDAGFRPACSDPRGMAAVEIAGGHRFWVDIYLLGVEHREHGTSQYGVEIADGISLAVLDYKTAVNIYAAHGKRLLTYDEFRVAAFGVTERSAAGSDPKTTGLDAARTSRSGLMQATGNLWVWGTDGDPDDPRPSFFGGSWISGSDAGSRVAYLDYWPEYSYGDISARGASDHLNLA